MPFLFLLLLIPGAFPDSFEHALSARCVNRARVFGEPSPSAAVVGIVEAGHDFPIHAVLPEKRCAGGYFLQIAADHFVCSSHFRPWAGFPVRRPLVQPDPFAGEIWRWRRTKQETDAFSVADGGFQRLFRLPENSLLLFRRNGIRAPDGRWMMLTGQGWAIAAGDLERAVVSRFHGRRLAGREDYRWALAAGDKRIPVRGGEVAWVPDRTWVRLAAVSLAPGDPLPACFPLADGGCIDARYLYAVSVAPPPPGTSENEKWIEVNIAAQTLTAYEGARPVYFTVVSTGRRGTETVPGDYNIHYKRSWQNIEKKKGNKYIYYYESIPYVQFYRGVFAFHPSPWHDAYGSVHSRGCVELSLADAAFLYFWTDPVVEPGYLALAATARRLGTRVRIVDNVRRPRAFASGP